MTAQAKPCPYCFGTGFLTTFGIVEDGTDGCEAIPCPQCGGAGKEILNDRPE